MSMTTITTWANTAGPGATWITLESDQICTKCGGARWHFGDMVVGDYRWCQCPVSIPTMTIIPQGWQCPVCRQCYGPHIDKCEACG